VIVQITAIVTRVLYDVYVQVHTMELLVKFLLLLESNVDLQAVSMEVFARKLIKNVCAQKVGQEIIVNILPLDIIVDPLILVV